MVVRYLARRTGDPALAEDLAQETFLRAAKAFLGWRGEQPAGWLLAIARNVHLDHARRAARLVPFDESLLDDLQPSDATTTDDVRAVVAALPAATGRLLALVYFDGFTPGEVAVMTGVSAGAVRTSLWRAREAFRAEWTRANASETTPTVNGTGGVGA